MYESWFHFSGRPFPSAPRTDCYFPTDETEQIRRSTRQCVELGTGPGLVIGPLGTGKTLMTLVLKADFAATRPVAMVRGSCLRSGHDLIQCLLHEFQRPIRNGSESEDRLALTEFLGGGIPGRSPAVLLDEAERVSTEVLVEIQSLSQLCREGQWALHVLLLGTESLEESLLLPQLRSLHQRITSRSRLRPFSKGATSAFIAHQIRRVAADAIALNVFPQSTIDLVYELTGGVQRVVQQLCEHALILAAVAGKTALDDMALHEAWADLQQLPISTYQTSTPTSTTSRTSIPSQDTFIEFGALQDSPPAPMRQMELPGVQKWFEMAPDEESMRPVELYVSKQLDRIEDDIFMAFSESLCEATAPVLATIAPDEVASLSIALEITSTPPFGGEVSPSFAPRLRVHDEAERSTDNPREKKPAPSEPNDDQETNKDQNPFRRTSALRSTPGIARRPESNPFLEVFDEEVLVVTPDKTVDRTRWRTVASVTTREGAAIQALALPGGPRGVFADSVDNSEAYETDLQVSPALEQVALPSVSPPCVAASVLTGNPVLAANPALAASPTPAANPGGGERTMTHRPRRFRRLFTQLMR